ncbi:unnamed protein product, partial [Meganyctiphanes norvegica]
DETALYAACKDGSNDVATELLKLGASTIIDIPSFQCETPLYVASRNGHLPVVNTLLNFHANKEIPNNDGMTPLHVASCKGYIFIIKELVDAGAKIDATSMQG